MPDSVLYKVVAKHRKEHGTSTIYVVASNENAAINEAMEFVLDSFWYPHLWDVDSVEELGKCVGESVYY